MTFTASDLRTLADHIESGAAICKSDYAGRVHLMLRAGADAMDQRDSLVELTPPVQRYYATEDKWPELLP